MLIPLLSLLACTSADTDTAAAAAVGCAPEAPELRSVSLSGVRLDYACQGTGPTILMLHGFPEFWMGWEAVMSRLSSDYRVVAPDQRGYNTSGKPEGVEAYVLDLLVADIDELIDVLGEPVVLVGHDWGGAVAWAVASRHPEQVSRLVIMNAPHINVFADQLQNNPEQAEASGYIDFFRSEGSEDVLAANDYALLAGTLGDVLDEEELAAYREAWGQPGALTGGLNWYRANFGDDGLPVAVEALEVSVPTLVMWGMDDTSLLPSNLDGLPEYVDDLEIIEVEGATHWIAHEVPDQVADAIVGFIGG